MAGAWGCGREGELRPGRQEGKLSSRGFLGVARAVVARVRTGLGLQLLH